MGSLVEDAVAAASWISQALTSSGYAADFSSGSLREIDRFLEEQSYDGRPTPGGLLATDLGPRLFALGAYVGEVLRRELGGAWRPDAEAPASEEGLTMAFPDGSVVWPIQRVLKRYAEGADNSIAAYGIALGLTDAAATPIESVATLVTDSCTTGWLDWAHGELWLHGDALIRTRRSGHPRNRRIDLAEIAAAALHRGRMNDRLSITMRSGTRHKLLWLRSDAAFGILRATLARTLQNRLTLD